MGPNHISTAHGRKWPQNRHVVLERPPRGMEGKLRAEKRRETDDHNEVAFLPRAKISQYKGGEWVCGADLRRVSRARTTTPARLIGCLYRKCRKFPPKEGSPRVLTSKRIQKPIFMPIYHRLHFPNFAEILCMTYDVDFLDPLSFSHGNL